jgi:hypothetical protein
MNFKKLATNYIELKLLMSIGKVTYFIIGLILKDNKMNGASAACYSYILQEPRFGGMPFQILIIKNFQGGVYGQ